jgi:hypothetical protein
VFERVHGRTGFAVGGDRSLGPGSVGAGGAGLVFGRFVGSHRMLPCLERSRGQDRTPSRFDGK